MTHEQLEVVLREWQRRLRLGHWDIQIRWHLLPGQNADGSGEVDSGCDAEIRIHDYHDQASIRLHEDWNKWDLQMANHTLVHELLHIFEHQTKFPLEKWLGESRGEAYAWDLYVKGAENWVDRLAIILVDLAGVVDPNEIWPGVNFIPEGDVIPFPRIDG